MQKMLVFFFFCLSKYIYCKSGKSGGTEREGLVVKLQLIHKEAEEEKKVHREKKKKTTSFTSHLILNSVSKSYKKERKRSK